ncbi:MAG: PQQ-like beta-propeller repeat protein [Acidimicrobiia bacterium]|nr:PQQ-like beta-propeller repeat protein [Acidimicrobiia bacterium]
MLSDRGEPSVLYDESDFGGINVTLADGTELFMRLPGISDDAEVSLWDETQFVVGGLSVSINFEPCTNRGFDAASPNERGQHYQLPEPSIVILCETYFPLQAAIFSGRDWQPEELEFLDLWLLAVGWELEQIHRDGQPHRGPLRAGEVVLFAPRFEGENLYAIDPETGYNAWFKWYGESLFLLAATDETAIVAPWNNSVIAVDATNGDERWRAEFGKYARVTRAVSLGRGEWLIAIEFTNEGDPSPPQLARLDAQGSVLWTAAGREGTDWAWDDPIVSDGRAFIRDVPHEWADAGRASVTAFDTETGDLLWRTELDSTSEGYPTRSLAIAQPSESFLIALILENELVVRLDPATGEFAWTGVKPPGRLLSVRDSTIRFGNSLSDSQYDVNPANGLLRGLVR